MLHIIIDHGLFSVILKITVVKGQVQEWKYEDRNSILQNY